MTLFHQTQWQFLKSAFKHSCLTHAYLLSGADGLGKKNLALEFVKMLNCARDNLEERPCHICSACRMIEKASHPDFALIAPEFQKKEIRIAQIRALIHRLSLKPFLSFYKTAIIDQAHLMNVQTQNCILKTLEEPKGKTVLILVSSHPESLLPTVRSRIQQVKFYPSPRNEIKAFLIEQGVSGTQLSDILNFSLGRPAKAMAFLKEPLKLDEEKKYRKEFLHLLNSGLNIRFNFAESFAKKPAQDILRAWLRFLREILLKKIEVGKDTLKIRNAIIRLEKAILLISTTNINKRLALESFLLEL